MYFKSTIAPCLWFDHQALTAAEFYTGIFENSQILHVSHYKDAGHDKHKQAVGSVMSVAFELNGQGFTALNGGPVFQFNEAISLQVFCDNQEEVDYYWRKLGEKPQPCGWLKDKFGLSWQVIPKQLYEYMDTDDYEQAQRVFATLMKMSKINIAELRKAFNNS